MDAKRTPEWVVKNFLSDYHQRHEAALSTISERAYMRRKYAEEAFIVAHFPEALAEFAYRIIRRTLETCDIGRPVNESLRDYFDDVIKWVAMPVARECANTNPSGLHEYREGCGQNCDECDYYKPVKD